MLPPARIPVLFGILLISLHTLCSATYVYLDKAWPFLEDLQKGATIHGYYQTESCDANKQNCKPDPEAAILIGIKVSPC
jgi:hypothetical protein